MKTIYAILLIFCFSCFSSFGADATNDLERLQGTWTIEKATQDGKTISPLIGTRFVFAGDKLTIEMKDGKTLTAMVKFPAATTHKQISIEPDPPKEGCTTQNNIYELAGDTLTLIQAAPPKVPTDMSDKGQQKLILKRKAP